MKQRQHIDKGGLNAAQMYIAFSSQRFIKIDCEELRRRRCTQVGQQCVAGATQSKGFLRGGHRGGSPLGPDEGGCGQPATTHGTYSGEGWGTGRVGGGTED